MKTWQRSLLCVLFCVVGLNNVVYAWPWSLLADLTLSVDGRDQPLSLLSSDVQLPGTGRMANPSIVSTPDGHLYAAYQSKGAGTNTGIIYSRSIDGGETWEVLWSESPSAESGIRYGTPSITYLETNTQKMIFVVYAAMNPSDGSASIKLSRLIFDSISGSTVEYGIFTIVDNLYLNSASAQIYPEICTDYPLKTSYPSLYVTYSSYLNSQSKACGVWVYRSQNLGQTWNRLSPFPQWWEWSSLPDQGYEPPKRPDIEYGYAGLFLVFSHKKSVSSPHPDEIVVISGGNSGETWSEPVRIAVANGWAHHPRVSVALNNHSVIVAYPEVVTPGIRRLTYAYSMEGGRNWQTNISFGSITTPDDDLHSVELGRSKTGETFYAAYWRDGDIYYTFTKTMEPWAWGGYRAINDGHTVSSIYSKPGIDFDPKKPDEGICAVWTDDRLGDLKTFFNSTSRRELFTILNVPFAQIGGSETMSYTMTIENIFEDLNFLTVTNQLSDLVTYTSGAVALNGVVQEPLAVTDGLWTYTTADLAYGDVLMFSFDVVVDARIDPGDLISNLINVQYVYGLSNTLLEYSREVVIYVETIPEPATWALLGLGLLGGGLLFRRKRRARTR